METLPEYATHNIGYGFRRYFVAEMKPKDRLRRGPCKGRRFGYSANSTRSRSRDTLLSREALLHREQRRSEEIEGAVVRPPEPKLLVQADRGFKKWSCAEKNSGRPLGRGPALYLLQGADPAPDPLAAGKTAMPRM